MLSSWFAPKGNEESAPERVPTRTTPRTSFSSPTDNQVPRSSAEQNPKSDYPIAYTTPHDEILANIFDTTHSSDPLKEEKAPVSDAEAGLHEDPPAHTVNTQQDKAQQRNAPDILYDPYDGSALGILVPHHDGLDTDDQSAMSALRGPRGVRDTNVDDPFGNDTMWTTLSQILEIQSQISKMHLEMEGVGSAASGDPKRRGHRMSTKPAPEQAAEVGDSLEVKLEDPIEPPGLNQPRKGVFSTVSTGDVEGDEEGVNVPNEEAEKDRIREEEFAKLKTQFEGRKEAMNGMMAKLDELSQALHKFQHLAHPTMDMSPIRNGSQSLPPRNSTSSQTANEDKVKGAPAAQAREPVDTFGRTEGNISSSTSVPQVPPWNKAKGGPVVTDTSPTKSTSEERSVPALMIKSMDLERQTHIMDSPVSTMGSLNQS